MAPSVTEVGGASLRSTRHNSSVVLKSSTSLPDEAPSIESSTNDAYLAKAFKSDLTSIRGLLTCTICDQLLYEPWTLACGHTYCYSCLCQWFKQHQHRKTCPDCRTSVTAMPAPSFTIKQMIEIFVGRVELLPADETVAQHRENIEAERMAVDIDRTTEEGLFKGCFKPGIGVHRQWVEEDSIYVCSGCHHEYIPGERRCGNCHILFEDWDPNDDAFLDDMESFDGDEGPELYDIEVDGMGLDVDDSDESDDDYLDQVDQVGHRTMLDHMMAMHGMHGLHRPRGRLFQGHAIDIDSGDEDDEEEDDGEEGSLRNFIVSDSPMRDFGTPGAGRSSPAASEASHITLSSSTDNDSEDEGIIQRQPNRARSRIHQVLSDSISPVSSDDDENTSISHRSIITNEPSQEDNESEFNYGYGGYSPLQGSDGGTEESNSDTIQELDREDIFRIRDSSSLTPRHSIPTSASLSPYGFGTDHSDDETDHYDRDGDVEMSLSPERSGASPSSDSDRTGHSSESSKSEFEAELGPATVFADDGDDDSDGSIRPPVRRRRHAHNPISATAARDEDEEEDVTLTQLFTRPPTGRRTSPTFDSQRILEWHASMRSSPTNRGPSFHARRADSAPSARPSRNVFQHPRTVDRVHGGVRNRHLAR